MSASLVVSYMFIRDRVGEHAFWECYSLQNIAVLSDDTEIAEDAFEDCPGTVKRGTGSLF